MAEIISEMLISHDLHETRVAIIEDKTLTELYIERPKRSVVGNVYLGRVKDVLPGMQAAFVDIGLDKNAFLYVDEVVLPEDAPEPPRREIQSLLKPGQQVMVQVIKDPMGTKGARVTTEITLPGRFVVLMPFSPYIGISRKLSAEERDRLHDSVAPLVPEGIGVIVRTAAISADAEDLRADIEFLLRLWRRVQHQAKEGLAPEVVYTEMDLALRMVRDVFGPDFKRLVVDDRKEHDKIVAFLRRSSPDLVRRVIMHKDREPLFEQYGIGRQVERALQRVVPLPSGGHIAIDKTEALTAIDVNTGSYVGRRNLAETILKTNLEAADEAVRQIRLRDIGGLIVIDFIDMEEAAHRALVQERLAKALERDRTRTRVAEISRLGIVEMTRKNVNDGLYGVLTEPCPVCSGEGRVLSEATRRIATSRRLREIVTTGRSSAYVIAVNPETYALLTGPGNNTVAALRAETGKHVTLIADPDCTPTEAKVLVEGRLGAT